MTQTSMWTGWTTCWTKTSPGGEWNQYFTDSLDEAQARYQAARAIYEQIALEAQVLSLAITTSSLPSGTQSVSYSATLAASGGRTPNTWSIASGSLPTGLSLNSSNGVILGTPSATGTYNFTIQVTDSSSPVQNVSKALSITIVAQQISTYTIWPNTAIPGTVDSGPDSAVQLGVKFRSDVAGNIIGIRFYKASTNTGTHVGSLWSSTGERLATATFTNETTSGWQQVNFAAPVSIAANTVYVASYYTSSGHYSIDTNYFATSGVDNAPLHALANGVSGANGVYVYGSSSSFPSSGWNSSNYWVDVVFQTGSLPDTTAPTVSSVSPVNNASGVSIDTNVTVTFSEAMDATTINATTIELRDPANTLVSASVTYNSTTRTATLDPSASLAYSTAYTATVKGGTSGVKDIAGNPLASNYTWSFTTGSAGSDPGQGSGGPILVIASSSNPFSRYYAEILRTEGFNSFWVAGHDRCLSCNPREL